MATVTMPQLGESVTEGTILKWLKQPGEPVALDDGLCEIETEKVTAELPSPYEGTMGEILVPEGETVEVGTPLCEVAEGAAPAGAPARAKGAWAGGPMAIPPDDETPEDESAPAAVAPSSTNGAAAPRPSREPVATVSSRGEDGRADERSRFYSPAVLRLASEHAIDLGQLEGSGVGGRITRKDVEAAIARGPASPTAPGRERQPAAVAPAARPGAAAAGAYEVVEWTATRRSIADNLSRSNAEAPQAWTMVEADVTALVGLREREKERFLREEGIDLTLLPYFTRAVCDVLRDHPALNARWEQGELRRYHAVHAGIAVAAESGLVVPVVHNAGDLSLVGLAKAIADLASRAQTRKLKIEDIEGGTITINNTGSFGSLMSKPIVNPPQVAIVTMERVVKRPVVVAGDAIAVRSMVNVCLSFDHRAMDGIDAGRFLAALKRSLEG